MNLVELVERAHSQSRKSGWYDVPQDKRNVGELLMLVVTELAEAMECYRDGEMTTDYKADGKPVGFPTEIADAFIRLGDLCGYLGINIERDVIEKMTYNAMRPYRHGNKKA